MTGSDPLATMRVVDDHKAGGFCHVSAVSDTLRKHHYLGASKRGFAWVDYTGILVFANPSSRKLPTRWIELVRWCIIERSKNAGSMQWARVVRCLKEEMPDITTVVSYSDPSAGHTGALYRSCNWLYAPTWHRLRPPPSRNGQWTSGQTQEVKDRWVFPLCKDDERIDILKIKDDSILRKNKRFEYSEPNGVSYCEVMQHLLTGGRK